MQSLSPEVLATLVAAEFVEAHPGSINDVQRDQLIQRIEITLRRAMRQEREACAALCSRRHTLWESTESRADAPEILRQEARFRANEAAYLADALRAD